MDRKSKGLKVEKATNSGFSSLSQRQLHPHGISLKHVRKLGKKEQRKILAILDNEEMGKSAGITY